MLSCGQRGVSGVFFCFVFLACVAHPAYIPFQESMRLAEFPSALEVSSAQRVFDFFERAYNKASSLRQVQSERVKIPTYIHYIWLGKRLPDEYRPFLQSWLDKHPDWTFVFWVDNPINYDLGTLLGAPDFDELDDFFSHVGSGQRVVVDIKNLQYNNRVYYENTKNYGERSDIIRWEIVYRYGGMYIDVDCECFKPFNELHMLYDFYVGLQPLDTAAVQLGAALFGAIPHHPILEHCIRTIKDDQQFEQIVVRTGPIHFTKSFMQCAGKDGLLDIAFPASYFYPCAYGQAGHPYEEWLRPESYATHHWAGSWLKKDGFKQ